MDEDGSFMRIYNEFRNFPEEGEWSSESRIRFANSMLSHISDME